MSASREGFFRTASEAVVDYVERLEIDSRALVDSFVTGFRDIDERLTGSEYGFIAVQSEAIELSQAFVAQVVGHIIVNSGPDAHLAVSLFGMSEDELMSRLIVSTGGVDRERMLTGNLRRRDFHRISEAAERIYQSKMHIRSLGRAEPTGFFEELRKLHRSDPITCAVFESLPARSVRSAAGWDDGASLVEGVVTLAGSGCTVFVSVRPQGGGGESRQRESMEQWAAQCDLIIELLPDTDFSSRACVVARISKNRFGLTFSVPLLFDKRQQHFAEDSMPRMDSSQVDDDEYEEMMGAIEREDADRYDVE